MKYMANLNQFGIVPELSAIFSPGVEEMGVLAPGCIPIQSISWTWPIFLKLLRMTTRYSKRMTKILIWRLEFLIIQITNLRNAFPG